MANTDVAFTESVKAEQRRRGSRRGYERLEQNGGWSDRVTPELAAFIAERNSFYLGTASAAGQPYIQHRGGPKGFLQVLDAHTLAFEDYEGNRQYISLGNLAENPRAFLFLMDYAARRRVKLWGRARVEPGPPRRILFTIEAWDANCPQHIPRMREAQP